MRRKASVSHCFSVGSAGPKEETHLLSEDDEVSLLLGNEGLEDLGNGERLELLVGLLHVYPLLEHCQDGPTNVP